MPAPYTIQESADISGLSVKFIRRLKDALPSLFEQHTDRGQANALLFDEEIVEVLRRIRDLKKRGQTLNQIRQEISQFVEHRKEGRAMPDGKGEGDTQKTDGQTGMNPVQTVSKPDLANDPIAGALQRENEVLRSQVTLLQDLVRRAEDRFDRLLPAGKTGEEQKRGSARWQLAMWIVEAIVVTIFASGFIGLIWLFSQQMFV